MFDNITNEALADEMGQLDAMIKGLEARLDAAKAEFKSRGIAGADGSKFSVTKSVAIRASLNQKAVLAEMGQKWWDDHCNLTEIATIRIKASVNPTELVKLEG
jgi:hypothetical protein